VISQDMVIAHMLICFHVLPNALLMHMYIRSDIISPVVDLIEGHQGIKFSPLY
jgi:hypothetical protein